jgi:hypothetical protein
VELVDGRRWQLPVARRFGVPQTDAEWDAPLPYRIQLPQALALQADGTWDEAGVIPKYARLWQIASEFVECKLFEMGLLGPPSDVVLARFDFAGQIAAAIECLAINYRVGPAEASRLGLLTIEHCRRILEVLIDQESFETLFKKKASRHATANMSPGAEDSCPDTPLPSPTSSP